MAGESARELARRQREKAARLTRVAEMYERGAAGEEATGAVLAGLPPHWTVLHDVHWPGRPRANIDHVAIGPAGVFVIDSKNWSGPVTVRGNVLRQGSYKREEAVVGAAEAALAVARLVPDLDVRMVVPVLCFTRDERLRGWARDVMVCTTSNLGEVLTSQEPRLTQAGTANLVRDLRAGLRSQVASPVPLRAPSAIDVAGSPARGRRADGSERGAARRARARGRRRAARLQALLGIAAVLAFLVFREPVTDRVVDLIAPTAEAETPAPAPAERPAKQRRQQRDDQQQAPAP